METFHLKIECFRRFVSVGGVLFSLASGLGLELLLQKTLSLLPNALQWNFVIKYLLISYPPHSHLQQFISLPIFCLFLFPLVLFDLRLCWLDRQFSLVWLIMVNTRLTKFSWSALVQIELRWALPQNHIFFNENMH